MLLTVFSLLALTLSKCNTSHLFMYCRVLSFGIYVMWLGCLSTNCSKAVLKLLCWVIWIHFSRFSVFLLNMASSFLSKRILSCDCCWFLFQTVCGFASLTIARGLFQLWLVNFDFIIANLHFWNWCRYSTHLLMVLQLIKYSPLLQVSLFIHICAYHIIMILTDTLKLALYYWVNHYKLFCTLATSLHLVLPTLLAQITTGSNIYIWNYALCKLHQFLQIEADCISSAFCRPHVPSFMDLLVNRIIKSCMTQHEATRYRWVELWGEIGKDGLVSTGLEER